VVVREAELSFDRNKIVFADPLDDQKTARPPIFPRNLMGRFGRDGIGVADLQLMGLVIIFRIHDHRPVETKESVGNVRMVMPGDFLTFSQGQDLHSHIRRIRNPLAVINNVPGIF